jgi:hypothetical protein
MEIEVSSDKDVSKLAVADMPREDEKSGYYAAILFLIWPALALVSALQNYRSHWAKNILWAFVAFYGFSFAIGAESESSDIVRYVAEIEYLHGIQMTPEDALNYYFQSGEVDVLRTFLAITISRFTANQAVITLIYGIIFGFFFSRNMWYVLNRLKGKMRPVTMLLLVCFFLVIPIWNITTFRMWAAAHIFIYGLLPFMVEGKWKGVAIASCSVLVHFTFVIPVGVMFLYILCGNRMLIYFVFFMATFFVSEINLEVFNDFVESYAPESIQERTMGYRGEDYVETLRKSEGAGEVWYAVWYQKALKWSVAGFLILIFFRGREFLSDHKGWMRLFCFTLLFYGVANVLNSLPSGGRFLLIANVSALALIILYIQNREHELVMKRFILAALPALLLFIIVAIRMGLYSMSATAILGNPVIALFLAGEHISLNDLMRLLL